MEEEKKPTDTADGEKPIVGFEGEIYVRGTPGWDAHRQQYASSSHAVDHDMAPEMIAYATNRDDIARAIRHASDRGLKLGVRTGGHQYSGASSTGAKNIQLDVSTTFRAADDFRTDTRGDKTYVRTSVSWTLAEFNRQLGAQGLFVPHGQCGYVRLGGHVQTGGFGQLGRCFGLLGDHVEELYYVDHRGEPQQASRTEHAEIFHAFLGGSPGNLGVLTHVLLEVHRDRDHVGSQGLKAVFLYKKSTLATLMDILAKMSDDENVARNYDLCVSVLGRGSNLKGYVDDYEEAMLEHRDLIEKEYAGEASDLFDADGRVRTPVSAIIVYAQWVALDGAKPDSAVDRWFESLREVKWAIPLRVKHWKDQPVSFLMAQWIFHAEREFDLPYVKRAYATASRALSRNGWVPWVVDQAHKIMWPPWQGQRLVYQIQCYGGTHSQFANNRDNGTAFSWRDTAMVAVMDNFYKPGKKHAAEAWQAENDRQASGGLFSAHERRFLWGSYGSYDLDDSWRYYFEDATKYGRLQQARKVADPRGTFEPNPFCVKRAD